MEKLLTARLKTITPNVYPNVAPMNYKTPCAVYQIMDTEPFNDFDGYSTEAFVTVMLAISSPSYGEAKALARAIRKDLATWSEDGVETVAWINETAAVDNSTQTTLHRFMVFLKFYVTDDE